MNCKGCKHWSRIENKLFQYYAPVNGLPHGIPKASEECPNNDTFRFVGNLPPSGFGYCHCPKMGNGCGPKYKSDIGYGNTDANDEMSIDGDEDSSFRTGENFGCIHFEPKP